MTQTDPTTTVPDASGAPGVAPTGVAPTPPPPPTSPVPAPVRSRAWLGTVALFVVVALLAGATVALFVRVQDAQDTADEAVVLAGNQDALNVRLDELDATLASLGTDATSTADDVAAARDQLGALRKCVNNAIDAWAEATQTGKAAAITKC